MTDTKEHTDNATALELIEEAFAEEKCASRHLDSAPDGYPCLITPVARMWFCERNKFLPVCLNMIRYRDALVANVIGDVDVYLCEYCGKTVEKCWEVAPL